MEKTIDAAARRNTEHDLNPDPITGAPGAHPVGAGIGAATGGIAAGAAVGAVAGPIGAVVGAVVGGVAGGLAGKRVAEAMDPTVEEAYWREHFTSRPYYTQEAAFDDYSPAYRYGWEARGRGEHRSWSHAESDLAIGWEKARGNSKLGWEKAKLAARDAWERGERALPGDSDGDGR
ncbi:MAG: hypothetical protein SGJ19_13895 [Planctomycetia bacterium]|nr:hypothetical protein [Planctomycetia bacterium]